MLSFPGWRQRAWVIRLMTSYEEAVSGRSCLRVRFGATLSSKSRLANTNLRKKAARQSTVHQARNGLLRLRGAPSPTSAC
jgi:hypothetical protein